MKYNKFGNTGIEISRLGFGCMRLPMKSVGDKTVADQDKITEMLLKAYEMGVNYFDSAYFYNDGQSEIAMGEALKNIRDKVYISTKSPGHILKKPGDYTKTLEDSLKKIKVDYIDFYHFHGIGYDGFLAKDKECGWMQEAVDAKKQGLIKHISFSFHDKAENMQKLIDLGIFESVLCQYNVLDRSNEKAIEYAKSKGLGVVVMGPIGGGRLAGFPKERAQALGISVKSSPELALRFVFGNPNVDCALSGMQNIENVLENAEIASDASPLSNEEILSINEMMEENKKLADLYCTGCSYCMPCPQEVNIPHIFRAMNLYKVYGIKDHARGQYNEIGKGWVKGKKADACVECGQCEERCPQKIKIIEQLKDCRSTLE